MPTKYLKLGFEDNVLAPDALRPLVLHRGPVGVVIEVGLNFYRGLPVSAIETLALTIDAEPVPTEQLLIEFDEKLILPSQLALASTEYWSVKKKLRVHVYNGGLEPGTHEVDLALILRTVYMHFAPGVWGKVDSSSTRTLELQESDA